MRMRKLLVTVDGTPPAQAAVATAFLAARMLKAHVEGLHVSPDPSDAVPLVGEGMSGAMVQSLVDLARTEATGRARAAHEMFEAVRRAGDVPLVEAPSAEGPTAAWRSITGREDDVIVREARLADLSVVARPSAQVESAADLTLHAALFESGRPVLVAPLAPPTVLADHVVVAWDGSAEAARAVAASLSFLDRARRVEIVTVARETEPLASPDQLMQYLAWHGIKAVTRFIEPVSNFADLILDASARADLFVMGAFTHSRIRELILGGVTRSMLERSSAPLLMAH